MTQTSIFRSPLSAGQYRQWIEFPNEFKKTPSVRFFVVYKETPTIEPLILVKSVTTYGFLLGADIIDNIPYPDVIVVWVATDEYISSSAPCG